MGGVCSAPEAVATLGEQAPRSPDAPCSSAHVDEQEQEQAASLSEEQKTTADTQEAAAGNEESEQAACSALHAAAPDEAERAGSLEKDEEEATASCTGALEQRTHDMHMLPAATSATMDEQQGSCSTPACGVPAAAGDPSGSTCSDGGGHDRAQAQPPAAQAACNTSCSTAALHSASAALAAERLPSVAPQQHHHDQDIAVLGTRSSLEARGLTRTPSNASSVVSTSHVGAGLRAGMSDDGGPGGGGNPAACGSASSPRRKMRPSMPPPQAQQQQLQQVMVQASSRSRSVPKAGQQGLAAAQGQRGTPSGRCSGSGGGALDPYAPRPGARLSGGSRKDLSPSQGRRSATPDGHRLSSGSGGSPNSSKRMGPKPLKQLGPYGSGQSRLSKATAFAAAAVIRSAQPQPGHEADECGHDEGRSGCHLTDLDLPVLPNYPKYPTPPASMMSEEAGAQLPQYDSGDESLRCGGGGGLEDSLEWSELSSSLPPSCFGTARVSRVLEAAEVQEMLQQEVGPDASAAARQLRDMVDDRSSDASTSSVHSSPAHRGSAGRMHHAAPSLHQHIYPGCPYPLAPASAQKNAAVQQSGMPKAAQAAEQQPRSHHRRQASGSDEALLLLDPRLGGLTSVAEEHIGEEAPLAVAEGVLSASSNASEDAPHGTHELHGPGLMVHGDAPRAMLAQLSLNSLPTTSQDLLGVSDLSSMAILAK